ncbi:MULTISPECIES: glycosyltransferase [Cyanophyceae]|uniref:glycosyltransferase family 2 protein n=1 Tax=Cyanophyceae TaxID=3028117 RepID=UPI001686FC93|nr:MULTISPECIES: glycosyltransferase [Cyanophyceae]MBD1918049.1 glycosyltransferase [Phormidium sp. FACHB-77]MBD2030082.1 glycosyltransferase [Phormidium sp. FACHB-322]MBD2051547.1 glycosyltransferase [Leptolyngbya sp. FACHB-60]
MTNRSGPQISIGLPVYNGDNFLGQALDSILAQTFADFELIISDNASTDKTETICRTYSAKDPRIHYIRNQENLGASANFNQAFALSSGKYFKWIAHDDLHNPKFLEKCFQVLDQDPSVVLVYSKATTIDPNGKTIRKDWGCGAGLSSMLPHQRFREGLLPLKQPIPLPIFGVIRASALRNTHLMAGYPDCDCALLAELSLYGRFYEVAEPLFLQREHELRAGPRLSSNPYQAVAFWDSKKSGHVGLPHWVLLVRHWAGVSRAPLGWRERLLCYKELLIWMKRNRQLLFRDLVVVTERAPVIGLGIALAHQKYVEVSWNNNLACLVRDINLFTQNGDLIICVDEACFGTDFIQDRRILPFLERDGQYYGPPADDDTAIEELERMRQSGASFIVFGWPALWWLDYYYEFHNYLYSKFSCIDKNSRSVIFALNKSNCESSQ